jgi:two-component system, OmpR family, sensor kinase
MLLQLGAVLPLSAWVLHSVLRTGFRTLEPVRAALAGSAEGDLKPLPLADAPAELQPLLQALNGMMDRVRMALDAERSFAARSAAALVRQLDRITTLSSRLLQLARVESGVAWRREPVDLALLARLVVDEFAESRPGGRLRLAMVDLVARQSGARLQLRSPARAGHGFEAVLQFDLAPA